jgi:hypothetical protein
MKKRGKVTRPEDPKYAHLASLGFMGPKPHLTGVGPFIKFLDSWGGIRGNGS